MKTGNVIKRVMGGALLSAVVFGVLFVRWFLGEVTFIENLIVAGVIIGLVSAIAGLVILAVYLMTGEFDS